MLIEDLFTLVLPNWVFASAAILILRELLKSEMKNQRESMDRNTDVMSKAMDRNTDAMSKMSSTLEGLRQYIEAKIS